MTTSESEPDYKGKAMKIVDDLIAADKGYDIFRGQPRMGLKLLPKAMRDEYKNGGHLEALNKFRRECPAFGLEATNGLEDLAIAQHYGLATYLLDWTTNPLVATYFACEEAKAEDGTTLDGEVFVLNNPKPLPDDCIKGDQWKELDGLWLYNPRLIDQRILRQKGLFTIQGLKTESVPDLLSSRHELVKHFVPAKVKKPLLEILYRMGVDRSTLFPDPSGLCDRINWETRNRVERNFPPVSGARVQYIELRALATTTVIGNATVSKQPESE